MVTFIIFYSSDLMSPTELEGPKPGLLDQEYLRMHSNDSCLNDEIEGYYYGKNYELMGKVFIFFGLFYILRKNRILKI